MIQDPSFPRLSNTIKQLTSDSKLQLFVATDKKIVLDIAVGKITSNNYVRWLSSGKPIVALVIAKLWEEKLLDIDDTIAKFIPEFAQKGKEKITIRHALTHTGGFRTLEQKWYKLGWDKSIEFISSLKLEPRWIVGKTAGYHMSSSWFILAEIAQRITKTPISSLIKKYIFDPIGIEEAYLGIPEDRYEKIEKKLIFIEEESKTTAPPKELLVFPNPASGIWGPIKMLGLFYQELLKISRGTKGIIRKSTLETFTQRARVNLFDKTFKAYLDWGLGFIPFQSRNELPERSFRFSNYASQRTAGHNGYRTSSAFFDPVANIAVSFFFSKAVEEQQHRLRIQQLTDSLYLDLGLEDVQEKI